MSSALKARFERLGYSLASIRDGKSEVPRLSVTQLPRDLPGITSTAERTELFLLSVLPTVLKVNERFSRDRLRLLQIGRQMETPRQLR